MKRYQFYTLMIVCALTVATVAFTTKVPSKKGVFAKSNLVAWCIVPYDVKNRNAEERAQMLNHLGITKMAYDWREKHIPYFDDELKALKKHHIKLQAFWYMSGPNPQRDTNLKIILDVLKRNKVKTQIWLMMIGVDMEKMTQQQKVDTLSKPVKYIAEQAAKIGCQVGLYNHGGWYGEPENQLAIINKLKMRSVGMVYNFHHAEEQASRFSKFYPKILPHLLTLNISGLKGVDPAKVVPVGEGDTEYQLMKMVLKSNYKGPIGIINEDTHPDAETGLKINMDGVANVLKSIGDKTDLKTY
ncbi:apurinic/apyrimidinic endonuclease family protein [Mucilaginibacter aquatilis]|nr:hypothetical protein [Mucilaginibacter aquatilis]